METSEKKKTTRGRQRIEIKKIQKSSQLKVTFSKRRAGLFKKAGELSVLCGVDVAAMAMSPGGKVFAFGSPSVDAVVDRFLGGDSSKEVGLGGRSNERYAEAEREKEKAATEGCGGGGGFWWDQPVGELGLGELESYIAALEDLKRNVMNRADELAVEAMAVEMVSGYENFSDYGNSTGGADSFCGFEENCFGFECNY